MRERLIRILIIGFVALLTVIFTKSLADWRNQSKVVGESIDIQPVSEKLEKVGEDVLGKAVSLLPGAPQLEEKGQTKQETEPIEQPVKNVQQQTELLIEAIKKLPEDQIEAIKKQIYKEVCEGVLKE